MTEQAPLHMPPFADFIAWLRETPDREFDMSKTICMDCPIGVFARVHNGEGVSATLDGVKDFVRNRKAAALNKEYLKAMKTIDNYRGSKDKYVMTADEVLKEIT